MSDRVSSTPLRILGTRSAIIGADSLSGVDTTILKTGALMFVSEVRAYYVFLSEDTSVPDDTAIVAPVNGSGRWHRMPSVDSIWSTQSEWYVDPIDGEDANAGDTSASPIQTMGELSRRVGTSQIKQSTRVFIQNDIPSDDPFVMSGAIVDGAAVRFIGNNPTTLASGTFSAVTNLVTGTTRPSVTVTGFDWNPFLGKRVRITASGTATVDTIFWVEEVDSGDATHAFVSTPYFSDTDSSLFPAFGVETLSAGDSFVVEELTKMGPLAIDPLVDGVGGGPWIGLLNTKLGDPSFAAMFLGLSGAQSMIYGSEIEAFDFQMGFGFIAGSKISAVGNILITLPSGAQFFADSFQGRTFLNGGGSIADFLNECSFTAPLGTFGEMRMRVPSVGSLGAHFFEWASGGGFTGEAILVDSGGDAFLEGLVWGTSTLAGTYGIRVFPGGSCSYDSANKPTVSGALAPGQDAVVGGTSVAYAAVPVFNSTNGAALVVRA